VTGKLPAGDAFRAADDKAELARFRAASRKAERARAEVEAREAEEQRGLQARLRQEYYEREARRAA
jgi:hypothetical protein